MGTDNVFSVKFLLAVLIIFVLTAYMQHRIPTRESLAFSQHLAYSDNYCNANMKRTVRDFLCHTNLPISPKPYTSNKAIDSAPKEKPAKVSKTTVISSVELQVPFMKI